MTEQEVRDIQSAIFGRATYKEPQLKKTKRVKRTRTEKKDLEA